MDAWIHETVCVITVMVKGYAMVMKLIVFYCNLLDVLVNVISNGNEDFWSCELVIYLW